MGEVPGGRRLRRAGVVAMVAVVTAVLGVAIGANAVGASPTRLGPHDAAAFRTTTPIKHLVVLFDENISFDHYFGTYPNASNTDGTPFQAAPNTPKVNGLDRRLLDHNPNAFNPRRLSSSQALTCDQDHGYGDEQRAFDLGRMDKFVEFTNRDTCSGQPLLFSEPGLVMDYYDGNTVTAMWNYAQHFAMSDNSYNTVFGPSTPGAVNLISGQTHGIHAVNSRTVDPVSDPSVVQSPDANGVGTVVNDPDPAFDDCSDGNHTSANNLGVMTGPNIGDLLNREKVTWGWFQGGFRPNGTRDGFAVCGSSHQNIGGNTVVDYSPHHEPFQYYASTSNPKHLAPSSLAAIGQTDRANHQYDLSDFDAALAAHNLPAVSFLKAAEFQDGHAGYSDPIDEQHFLVDTINKLERSPEWSSTAVVIAYDDSDGWYDHQASPIVNGSTDPALDVPGLCGRKPAAGGALDRCGYGPRTPLVIVSPFSKVNFVDHHVTDQTSILKFVEDNWRTGRIGGGSFDARAGRLEGMLALHKPTARPLLLAPDGQVIGGR